MRSNIRIIIAFIISFFFLSFSISCFSSSSFPGITPIKNKRINPKGNVKILAEGKIKGYIAESLSGTTGFGYDPLFYVPKYEKTFAELGEEIKNQISHRALALKNFKEQFVALK